MERNIFQRGARKISLLLFNNVLFNRLWIFLGRESWIQRRAVDWKNVQYDPAKSLSENVGFSHHPEIEASRNNMHALLLDASHRLKHGDRILEVGCGTGIFLEPLQENYSVTGIDLSRSFLMQAKQQAPKGIFIEGDYLEARFDQPFHLIFLESSMQYFMPSQLQRLFRKFYTDLVPEGILIIHYSHALSKKDVTYHDLSYVRYSPAVIAKHANKYFAVLQHHHYTDERTVTTYDSHHYLFPTGNDRRTDTNLNTYWLMAQRKH